MALAICIGVCLLICCAIVIAQAQAGCEDTVGLGELSGPGSLGGVMGTGVSAEEIMRARKHPSGGTQIVATDYRSTAYAPAAGGINCDVGGSCNSTASGIVVKGGERRAYLIASNPAQNKYGALVYIWPNPYSWKGPFVVADTGGNFDGSDGKYRVDFYTWGQEGKQRSAEWGNQRMVRLSKTPIKSLSAASTSSVAVSATKTVANVTASPANARMTRPTSGPILSGFGQRWGRAHEGVDISPPAGTPIVAALAGRVVFLGQMGGYGNYTCIAHAGSITTCYAHQQRFAAGMKNGSTVAQGQLIGYVGSTGHSTGPHLHFEVRKGSGPGGQAVDPAPYLSGAVEAPQGAAEGCAATDEGAPMGEGLTGIKAAMDYLERRRIPYCYGGGHGTTPAKMSSGQWCISEAGGRVYGSKDIGYDCSSSTSWILQKAGINVQTMTSEGFMSWGKPGPGKHVSIYANKEHVYVVVDGKTFQTSVSNYRHGPGYTPSRSSAGFTVRHPEGL